MIFLKNLKNGKKNLEQKFFQKFFINSFFVKKTHQILKKNDFSHKKKIYFFLKNALNEKNRSERG